MVQSQSSFSSDDGAPTRQSKTITARAFHTRLVDSYNTKICMEVFQVKYSKLDGSTLGVESFLLLRVGRVGWWRGLFGRGGVLGKMGNQNLLKHCLLFGFLATPGYRGWAHLHKYVWQPPIENLHGTRKMIASEQILLFQGSMFRFHIDFPGMKSISKS